MIKREHQQCINRRKFPSLHLLIEPPLITMLKVPIDEIAANFSSISSHNKKMKVVALFLKKTSIHLNTNQIKFNDIATYYYILRRTLRILIELDGIIKKNRCL